MVSEMKPSGHYRKCSMCPPCVSIDTARDIISAFYVLASRLTGDVYLNLPRNILPELL